MRMCFVILAIIKLMSYRKSSKSMDENAELETKEVVKKKKVQEERDYSL